MRKIIRKSLTILIGLIVLTFTGCIQGIEENPEVEIPNLRIISDNQDISVEKGGYEWIAKIGLFEKQSIIVDASSPEEIAKEMSGDKVTSKSKLKLEFSEKPDKVTVIPWGEFKDADYSSTKNTITVPEKEGTYIFEVIGEWNESKASYTTKVIVENN